MMPKSQRERLRTTPTIGDSSIEDDRQLEGTEDDRQHVHRQHSRPCASSPSRAAPPPLPRAAAPVQRPLPDRPHGAALCSTARRCSGTATHHIPNQRGGGRGVRGRVRLSGRAGGVCAKGLRRVCLGTGRVCVRVPAGQSPRHASFCTAFPCGATMPFLVRSLSSRGLSAFP